MDRNRLIYQWYRAEGSEADPWYIGTWYRGRVPPEINRGKDRCVAYNVEKIGVPYMGKKNQNTKLRF